MIVAVEIVADICLKSSSKFIYRLCTHIPFVLSSITSILQTMNATILDCIFTRTSLCGLVEMFVFIMSLLSLDVNYKINMLLAIHMYYIYIGIYKSVDSGIVNWNVQVLYCKRLNWDWNGYI